MDSVGSYVQVWAEDGIDEDWVDEWVDSIETGTDAGEKDGSKEGMKKRKKTNRVRFADTVTMRPIPLVGKGAPTPPRGASRRQAKWPERESVDSDVANRSGSGSDQEST